MKKSIVFLAVAFCMGTSCMTSKEHTPQRGYATDIDLLGKKREEVLAWLHKQKDVHYFTVGKYLVACTNRRTFFCDWIVSAHRDIFITDVCEDVRVSCDNPILIHNRQKYNDGHYAGDKGRIGECQWDGTYPCRYVQNSDNSHNHVLEYWYKK